MTNDTRTNEQIVAEAKATLYNGEPDWFEKDAQVVLAALAAAGRLVTPEHDAQVLRDAADIAARMYAGTDGSALEKAWIGGCQATENRIRKYAAEVEQGGAS